MPDQELTALKIRIEADIANALKQLNDLGAAALKVASDVEGATKRITTALNGIDANLKLNVDTSGINKIDEATQEAVTKARKRIKDLANLVIQNVPIGFDVNLGELEKIKKELKAQQLKVTGEAELTNINAAIKRVETEIQKRRAVKIETVVDTTDTITALQVELDRLKDKRAIIKISGDASELLKINEQIAFVENRLKVLTNTKIIPVIDRSSLDQFVAGVKSGLDVTINDLRAFKAEADKQLRFAPRVDRAELSNISRFLGEEIKRASAAAEIKPTLDLSGIANTTFNKLKIGAEVSIDDLVKAKKFFESQVLTLTTDADIAQVNDKIRLIDEDINRKRTLTLDANTAPAQTKIDALKVVNNVVLGIDVSIDELQQVKNELKRQKLTLTSDLEIGEVNRKIDIVEGEINRLNNIKINPLTNIISPSAIQNTQVAKTKLDELRNALQNTAAANGTLSSSQAGLTPVSAKAAQSLQAFEQVLRDSPSFAYSASQGLIAISNNIGPLTDRYRELSATAKLSGQSVGSALLSAAKSPLGVTVGISALVSIITILVAKFQQAGSAAKDLAKDTDEAKQAIDGITNTIAQEAAQVSALVGFIQKETTTRDEKGAALKKLTGINEQYFGQLKNEDGLIAKLNTSYAAYINSLNNTALAKAGVDKLAGVFKEILDLQLSLDPNFGALELNLDIAGGRPGLDNGKKLIQAFGSNVKKNFNDSLPGLQSFVGGKVNQTFDLAGKEVEKGFLSGVQTFDLAGTNRELAAKLNQADFLKKFIAQFSSPTSLDLDFGNADGQLKDFYTAVLQAEKELQERRLANLENFNNRYIDTFSALRKQLSIDDELAAKKRIIDLDYQIKIRGIDQKSPFAGQLATLYKLQAEEELKKVDIEVSDQRIKVGRVTLDVDDFTKELARQRKEITDDLNFDDIIPKFDGSDFNTKLKLPPLVFDTNLKNVAEEINFLSNKLFGADFDFSRFDASTDKLRDFRDVLNTLLGISDSVEEEIKALNDQIQNIIAGTIADGIGSIAESFLDGTQTLKNFGEQLKQIAKDLTVALIKFAAFTAIKAALPGIGSILGLASGGIVNRPTLAMIGEGRESEAVLPLSFLRGLIGGDAAPGGRLTAELSMDSIIFALDRNSRRQGRSFGG